MSQFDFLDTFNPSVDTNSIGYEYPSYIPTDYTQPAADPNSSAGNWGAEADTVTKTINSLLGGGLSIFNSIEQGRLTDANINAANARADADRAAAELARSRSQQAADALARGQAVQPSSIPKEAYIYGGVGLLLLVMFMKR